MGRGLDQDTLELTLDAIREYTANTLDDQTLLKLDHDDVFPEKLVRSMCGEELGVSLLFIDPEYGGMGGGAFDVYRVCEVLARADLGVATGVLATFLGMDPISVGGTPEQKKRYMTRLADEGLLMAYAATEPEAGSDLGALRTTAVPENGGYRIQGAKQWISNGAYADLYAVLAKAPGGPSWFVVERGTEGLSAGRPEDKHGIRASNTSSVNLDGVYADKDALLGGEEGLGLMQAQEVFGYTRLMVAAFGVGCGWEALDRAMAYSRERIQAGSPLSEKLGYTHKLIVPHVVRLEAARAAIEETAQRIDAGEGALNTEGAIAKYVATEAGNAAAEAAIQALGGYGYTREYVVEKIKRDVKITTIYEGTSEIMEMTIARDRWQQHLKTRGEYFRERAAEIESLDGAGEIGGPQVAAAFRALAELFELARVARLTRHQHVLLRLGELAAITDAAASFTRRVDASRRGELPEKSETRFNASDLAPMARVYGRETLLKVATEGGRLVAGCEAAPASPDELMKRVGLAAALTAQNGLVRDMDSIGDALYGRA